MTGSSARYNVAVPVPIDISGRPVPFRIGVSHPPPWSGTGPNPPSPTLTHTHFAVTGMGSPNWALTGCCQESQWLFLGGIAAFSVVDLVLWRFTIMRPFKLLAVLVHEMCHAIACWMTCGKVSGMEIGLDEGGVTKYRGGWRSLITPAGYIGGAFWGAAAVLSCTNLTASYVASCLFLVGLLVALAKARNGIMRFLSLLFIVILGGSLALAFLHILRIVPLLNLFLGVFLCVFSIYDIYDDTIRRTVAQSDASTCSSLYPCLPFVCLVATSFNAIAHRTFGLLQGQSMGTTVGASGPVLRRIVRLHRPRSSRRLAYGFRIVALNERLKSPTVSPYE